MLIQWYDKTNKWAVYRIPAIIILSTSSVGKVSNLQQGAYEAL